MKGSQRIYPLLATALLAALGLGAWKFTRTAPLPRPDAAPTPPATVEALKETAEPPGDPGRVAERIQEYTEKIGLAAASMSSGERKPLLAAQRVFAPMSALMAEYASALKSLNDQGSTAPDTLTSPEIIAARLALVYRFQTANQHLMEFYRGLESSYQAELDKEGLPAAMKTNLLGVFRRGVAADSNLTIRECDEEIAKTLVKLLELLRREWGAWKIKPEGELTFEHEQVLGEYVALQERLRQATTRQKEAQKALLKRAQKR